MSNQKIRPTPAHIEAYHNVVVQLKEQLKNRTHGIECPCMGCAIELCLNEIEFTKGELEKLRLVDEESERIIKKLQRELEELKKEKNIA